MNYPTERQLTTRQNKHVFEEVYFSDNMTESNHNSTTGYLLKYPQQFSVNPSAEKSIAPRRVNITPSAVKFSLAIEYQTGVNAFQTTQYHVYDITPQNTTQEMLYEICNNSLLQNQQAGTRFAIVPTYDRIKGTLTITAVDTNGANIPFRFCLVNYDDYVGCWHFLNQPGIPFANLVGDNNYDNNSTILVNQYSFNNVWNRDLLYVHTSFSNSQRHYLCLSNEFWDKPSKLFFDNIHGNEFYLYFTTDGTNRIIPWYANKLLELSFILRTSSFN